MKNRGKDTLRKKEPEPPKQKVLMENGRHPINFGVKEVLSPTDG